MIRQAYLTERYVDEIELPTRGEHWIADTAQPGFGLRIWATKNGAGKAYSVRGTSPDGITIRRSANVWELSRHNWLARKALRTGPTIGDCLPAARKWARDQLDQIRGRPTLRDEERSQSARSARWGRNLTLQRAAEAVLVNLSLAGRSVVYRDRLDKLFSKYVPEDTQLKRLHRIKSSDLDAILNSPDLTPENLRVLRPFLFRCLNICQQVKVRPHASILWREYEGSAGDGGHSDDDAVGDQTSSWSTSDFHSFLESMINNDRWQQGLCLSFYFYTRAALSQLMTARWNEFSDIAYRSRLDPDAPLIWRREWRHVGGRFNHNQLTRRAQTIFATIVAKHESLNLESEYLFPSKYGRSAAHIRSIDHVWREGLATAGLRYLSPKHMRALFYDKRFFDIWKDEERLFSPAENDQLRPNCPKTPELKKIPLKTDIYPKSISLHRISFVVFDHSLRSRDKRERPLLIPSRQEYEKMKHLSMIEISVIKARIARGDKYSEIAADYRINQGRLTDLKYGRIHADIAAAHLDGVALTSDASRA